MGLGCLLVIFIYISGSGVVIIKGCERIKYCVFTSLAIQLGGQKVVNARMRGSENDVKRKIRPRLLSHNEIIFEIIFD